MNEAVEREMRVTAKLDKNGALIADATGPLHVKRDGDGAVLRSVQFGAELNGLPVTIECEFLPPLEVVVE